MYFICAFILTELIVIIQFAKRTVKETISVVSALNLNGVLNSLDLNALRKTYQDRLPAKQPTLKSVGISPVIFDPPGTILCLYCNSS
jgi:hypothetical protein